ncbi:MAG: cupin domain-containing protein [Candidatus Zixiibacteriota bacterium]
MIDLPKKAKKIIEQLDMKPLNVEGGFFVETMRPKTEIKIGQRKRELYTTIYFLLAPGLVSLPHVLKSDEIWHFYFGDPVCLRIFESKRQVRDIILGDNLDYNQKPQALAKAGEIQAAYPLESQEGFSLMATTVVPAFVYKDFELVDIEELKKHYPMKFIEPFLF